MNSQRLTSDSACTLGMHAGSIFGFVPQLLRLLIPTPRISPQGQAAHMPARAYAIHAPMCSYSWHTQLLLRTHF